jgi:hypothetical protein
MKRILLASLFALSLHPPLVRAQSGGAYSMTWNTLNGGGQTFGTGGSYRLGGTAGQPDAGQMAGGAYSLAGGFWVQATQPTVDTPLVDPVPLTFALRRPQPNPFRVNTTFAFDLPTARSVELVVHAVDGRVIRRLAEGGWEVGRHLAVWDGRDDRGHRVPSGLYFVRLVAGDFTSTQRIVRLD